MVSVLFCESTRFDLADCEPVRPAAGSRAGQALVSICQARLAPAAARRASLATPKCAARK
jgi:hypothetical protein